MATPPDLFDTLKEFYDAGREIKQVVFVGSGWIVLADKNSYAASIPDEELGDYQSLLDKLREYFDTGQAIKQIATKAPPNPFWIILTEGGYYGRGPQTLSDTLGEFSTAGCEIRNVAFSGSQGWIVLRGPCRSK
ncbi:MAG: hypothetical protein FJZ88_10305 [Chloroflexi bacterium]|nr:hypothetical protein [Chloroflexota bacterium]